jgi:hypothetical protein
VIGTALGALPKLIEDKALRLYQPPRRSEAWVEAVGRLTESATVEGSPPDPTPPDPTTFGRGGAVASGVS